MFKCPYCGFECMSKVVLDRHIQEAHKDIVKKESKKKSKVKKGKDAVGVSKKHGDFMSRIINSYEVVKVVMLDGREFIGKINNFTTYQIELRRRDDDKVMWIWKHAIAWIEGVESRKPKS